MNRLMLIAAIAVVGLLTPLAYAEKQPHMQHALQALENARGSRHRNTTKAAIESKRSSSSTTQSRKCKPESSTTTPIPINPKDSHLSAVGAYRGGRG
jgi:hypothetical protein